MDIQRGEGEGVDGRTQVYGNPKDIMAWTIDVRNVDSHIKNSKTLKEFQFCIIDNHMLLNFDVTY